MSQNKVTVIGLGGCGCNSVKYAARATFNTHLNLFCCTTELVRSSLPDGVKYIQLGENVTHGISTGGDVEKGRLAAESTRERLAKELYGADLVVVCAGLGGGTGTGAIKPVLDLLSHAGSLSLVIATLPFPFEGKKKAKLAKEKAQALLDANYNLVLIDNSALSRVLDKKTTLQATFDFANQALYSALSGVLTLVLETGLINIDLSDLKVILSHPGMCSVGEIALPLNELTNLKHESFMNPLSPDVDLSSGQGAILHISAPETVSLDVVDHIGLSLQQAINPSALIVTGMSVDNSLSDHAKVFYLISGLK